MARQQTGGQSRGGSKSGGRTTGGRSNTRGSTNTGTSRNPTGRESNANAGTRNDARSENADRSFDQERQLELGREGSSQAEGRGQNEVQGGTQRGLQTRGGQQSEALGSRNQTQPSLLPALMANPWLMTNAFLTNPFGFTQALNQEMDRLFTSSFGDITPADRGGSTNAQSGRGLANSPQQWNRGLGQWAPQVEVRQRGNELTICADLPGMTPDDVNIEIENGVLTISGERQQSSEDRQEGFYRSERSYGSFARSIPLPEGVDENQVEARFENGVLEVTVPVPEQRQRGRRIQIQSATSRNSTDQPGSERSQ